MTVEVSFCIKIERDICLSEKDIDTNFNTYRSGLLSNDNLYGELIITSPGQPDIHIDDEVWATVQNLCFLAIPDLLAGKSVRIPYFRYASELKVDTVGPEVSISGEFVRTGRFMLQPLVIALYSCGQRFIQFLRRLSENDPNYEALIQHLEQQVKVARQALNLE